MIGLVDYDWCVSTSTTKLVPNLEIMKLATYYRMEERQFCRLLSLDAVDLASNDVIYFFSEQDNPPPIPEAFLKHQNVIYGGSAFTRRQYIPFENSIIDSTLPKPNIYKEFLKQKYDDGIKPNVISHVLDDTYYRHYAGTHRLPMPAIQSHKRLILYDRDFFYDDWKEMVEKATERNVASIVRIHPIVCHKLSEYFQVRAYPRIARSNDIILDINIPLNEVAYMFKQYKNLFLADITSSSNVFLPIGGNLPTRHEYCQDLIYKLNLLYSFWSCGILMKLRVIEPFLGKTNPLINLAHLLETWSYLKNKDRTVLERVTKKNGTTPAGEELNMLLARQPAAKHLFQESYNSIQKKGRWQL